jgi:hypothetical protein
MLRASKERFHPILTRSLGSSNLLLTHRSQHSIHLAYASRPPLRGRITSMFNVGESLQAALEAARERLSAAAQMIARANAGRDAGRGADAAMAQTARVALFSEALLAAEHARFEEIKAVTK